MKVYEDEKTDRFGNYPIWIKGKNANSQKIEELGQFVVQGFLEGVESVEREKVANNALKMSGMPMKRKKSRKDKRGEIRRNIISMGRILKI